jgi:hypothetical protein
MIPYPLQWPEMMPRWEGTREGGQFRTSLGGAIKNVQDSLKRFAADSGKPLAGVVISSNVTLGADKPADPGVSVWFTWDGMSVCIPVDRYSKVEANLQAIHHIIEARRTELRHGTLALVRATFAGFTALPAPAASRSWRQVLQLNPGTATRDQIERAYRQASKTAHPDAPGGSHDAMSELNRAREKALKEIGA